MAVSGPTGASGVSASSSSTTSNAAPPRPALTGRGKTVISQHVMEQVTSQIASEVTHAGGTSGGLLGFGSHTDLSARPGAKVELSGQQASIALEIVLDYPAPLAATTDRVRRHVITKVQQLTGVEVTRVDIDVTGLHLRTDEREALR